MVKSRDPDAKAATWPKPVDWFDHPIPTRRKASAYKSPLKNHWSRWSTEPINLPPIIDGSMALAKKSSRKNQGNEKGARGDVDFGRLLTLDYQREWLQKRQENVERERRRAKV